MGYEETVAVSQQPRRVTCKVFGYLVVKGWQNPRMTLKSGISGLVDSRAAKSCAKPCVSPRVRIDSQGITVALISQ